MDCTLDEYLEDTKRHLTYYQTEEDLKIYYTYDYTYEQVLENKDYFESCLDRGISTYKALLFFCDYLNDKKKEENIDKLEKQLDYIEKLEYRMREEGFDYCFKKYSKFSEIDDIKFHELRNKYVEISNDLEAYVNNMYKNCEDEIEKLQDDSCD